MLRTLKWWTAGAVLGAGLAAGIACGGGSSSEKSPAATQPPATAAAASPTAAANAPTSAATTAATSAPAGTSAAGTTELALVASNLLFDKSELKAAPGAVTVTVDNKDGGVPHNFHVFKGGDASGESVGMTDLTVGPAKETVTLTLAKGEYFFQCDAHPATMSGKLEVE